MAKIIVRYKAADRRFHLEDITSIGRVSSNTVQIDDPRVSKYHAQILSQSNGRFLYRDLASLNGSFVEGRPIAKHLLRSGDEITLGGSTITFLEDLLPEQKASPNFQQEAIADAQGRGRHVGKGPPPIPKPARLTEIAIGRPNDGSLSPGMVLAAKYNIIREIGRGGMGVVYEAKHIKLKRLVAIKVLTHEGSNDPDIVLRLEREAQAASIPLHRHIISVFDVGCTPDGFPFMVMELLKGETLAERLQRQRSPLPIPFALYLIAQVLDGLSAAHRHDIVHRDIKPANIFLVNDDRDPNFVKIVDFGLAKFIATPVRPTMTGAVQGTANGVLKGTPNYMSPEQATGQNSKIDHRTDIYSVGVVLYEMLCRTVPFEGGWKSSQGKYRLPRELRLDIPDHVEKAIVRAIDPNIEKRFASASAMRNAIHPPF